MWHLYNVSVEMTTGSLPCLLKGSVVRSGYRSISKFLRETEGVASVGLLSAECIARQEQRCLMNDALVSALFSDSELFGGFVEPALLSAHGFYACNWWMSRLFPLRMERDEEHSVSQELMSLKQIYDHMEEACVNVTLENASESDCILFAHIKLLQSLPKLPFPEAAALLASDTTQRFIAVFSHLLDSRTFKVQHGNGDVRPVHFPNAPPTNETQSSSTSLVSVPSENLYTGVFAALVAVALFYTVKHR